MNQNPSQNQNSIPTIQPSQATKLLNALKEQLAQAQSAGADTAKAKQHYARAEQIKQVLLNYRQQQQRQRSAGAAAPGGTANGAANTPSVGGAPNQMNTSQTAPQQMQSSPVGLSAPAGNSGVSGQYGLSQYGARNMGSSGPVGGAGPASSPGVNTSQGAPRSGTTPGATGGLPNTAVTVERYQDLRKRLLLFEQKIRTLESSRRPDMSADEANKLKTEIQETRQKYTQYSRYLTYMKSQLVGQAQGANAAGPTPTGSGGAPLPNTTPLSATGPVPSAPMSAGPSGQGVSTPTVTNALIAASNANNAQSAGQGPPSRALGSTGAVPTVKQEGSFSSVNSRDTMVGSGVNLSLVTKPSVPTLPISNSINVKPSNPVVIKPGANNIRPTLTGGSSTSLGQIVASPAVTRMPTYEMASGGPMQDNSGRVLTKRKLTELVNSLGADEGDGKTTIDGDVEELLLDLADEFVSSVTSFACRLAKHRKADSVDVKDVQLHLERNWNIRIPGYATEEIRSTRKWQPSAAYNQKLSGVDIVKSVNGNIN